LVAYLTLVPIGVVFSVVAARLSGESAAPVDLARQAMSAVACVAWSGDAESGRTMVAVHSVIGAIAACGVLTWIWVLGPLSGAAFSLRGFVAPLAGWLIFLVVCANLVTMLETPRGGVTRRSDFLTNDANPRGESLSALPPAQRFGRSLLQVVSAAGTGGATEPIDQSGLRDVSKLVLCIVLLAGGLLASPAGGVSAVVLARAGGAFAASLWSGQNAGRRGDEDGPVRLFGRVVVAQALLVIVVAIGLCLIEAMAAASFDAAPTVGDALLESSAITCGGAITTGLTDRVTSPNLSRGMAQTVDLYWYGMCWIFLAMWIGRSLPIILLSRGK
jgi:Trk-type K+ transport system membrane component